MAVEKPKIDVTAGLIWKKGRVLVTRRPKGSHLEGMWEFPGGKKEPGETLEECVKREIKEELGLDIEADKHLLKVTHEYETKIVDLHVYKCHILEGIPKPLENQEIAWVKPDELNAGEFPPPDKKVIEFIMTLSDLTNGLNPGYNARHKLDVVF